MAYGILDPTSGIESMSMVAKASGPYHWTTREFPIIQI